MPIEGKIVVSDLVLMAATMVTSMFSVHLNIRWLGRATFFAFYFELMAIFATIVYSIWS